MSFRGQSWYGDPRSHAPELGLTCPSPKCQALNSLDSNHCVECGELLGLKPKEEK